MIKVEMIPPAELGTPGYYMSLTCNEIWYFESACVGRCVHSDSGGMLNYERNHYDDDEDYPSCRDNSYWSRLPDDTYIFINYRIENGAIKSTYTPPNDDYGVYRALANGKHWLVVDERGMTVINDTPGAGYWVKHVHDIDFRREAWVKQPAGTTLKVTMA